MTGACTEAPTAEQIDRPQIHALYKVLARVAPGPVVTLSRAVALAMVLGPRAGLALLGTLDIDDPHGAHPPARTCRDPAAARESYLQRTRDLPIG